MIEEINVKVLEMRSALGKWNFEDFFSLLSDYLNLLNRENFEGLLVELFRLSLLEDDKTFGLLFDEIIGLSRDDYSFNGNIYLQDFYKSEQYRLCIEVIRNLFQFSTFKPKLVEDCRFLFDILAKSFFKLSGNWKSAVRKYLVIVTLLNNNSDSYDEMYDYTDWIAELSTFISCRKSTKRARQKINNK